MLLRCTRRLLASSPANALLVDTERYKADNADEVRLSALWKTAGGAVGRIEVKRAYVDVERHVSERSEEVLKEVSGLGFACVNVASKRRGKAAPAHIRIAHDTAELVHSGTVRNIFIATDPTLRVGYLSTAPHLTEASVQLWLCFASSTKDIRNECVNAGVGVITGGKMVSVPFSSEEEEEEEEGEEIDVIEIERQLKKNLKPEKKEKKAKKA